MTIRIVTLVVSSAGFAVVGQQQHPGSMVYPKEERSFRSTCSPADPRAASPVPLGAKVGAIPGAFWRTTADAGEHRKRG